MCNIKMKTKRLLLLWFMFVNYRCTDAASDLFNAFGTMIGRDNINNKEQPLNPLLPMNPSGIGNNNNFRSNTGFNSNFGGSGSTSNDNENFRFKFMDPNKYRDPDEISIENRLKLGTELSEDEKLAAQKFPGIKDLLDKLKELNRQKELQKQKENNGGLPDTDKNVDNNGNGNAGNNIDGDEEKVSGKEEKWLKLTKKKFYFQAQPVRPENEIVVEPEVVYYMN